MKLSAGTRRALRRLDRARRERPRLFFEPSPALSAFVDDDHTRICVLAANRTGKTWQGIYKLVQFLADHPGTRARVVGPTTKRVNRVHSGYFAHFARDLLTAGCLWQDGRGFNGNGIAVLVNGSSCEFMSYEMHPQSGEGDEFDVVLLDEPPPSAWFTAAEARVFSRQGRVWVLLTAVDRPVDWLKEVVEQGVADRAAGRGDGWSFYQVALTAENCPWYTPAQIEERVREANRTPWQYHQRILGAWEGVSDARRFVGFGEPNLVRAGPRWTQGWPWVREPIHLALSVDHGEGPGHSHWLLWGWQTKEVNKRVRLAIRALGEWTNPERMSARGEAHAVLRMVEGLGIEPSQLAFVVGDTNATTKSTMARTLNELFEQEFAAMMGFPRDDPRVSFRPARKGPDSIDRGVVCCNQLLDERIGTLPALQVAEGCKGVVRSLQHWCGKDDDLKHAADAFRYGVEAIVHASGYVFVRLLAEAA